MQVFEGRRVPIKAWVDGVEFEDSARKQVENLASMPFVFKHVAVMPDVHSGIGATVGSVIATTGAIIPAAVGVDIGCFTGDTEVVLADSKRHQLRDLASAAGGFVVYACTREGRIHGAWATAKKTRESAALVAVNLDNGEVIRCTPDHEFMLRDGAFCQADSLESGASLMPFESEIDLEGYLRIFQPNTGKPQRAHWLLARSGLLGDVPRFEGQRTIIHHRNFDESDNTPDNLQFMGANDHSAYHRSLVERNEHWQSPEFEAARKDALRAKAETAAGHAYFAGRGNANIKRYMDENREAFLASVAGNGARGAATLRGYNRSERGRKKSSEVGSKVRDCPDCGRSIKSAFAMYQHRLHRHGIAANHRVVSVTAVEEREDVYCLTVPEYGNFALAAGVFVHNCGVIAQRTSLTASDLPDNLGPLRTEIEAAVPHGRTDNGKRNDVGAWQNVPDNVGIAWQSLEMGFHEIVARHPKVDHKRALGHLGTLGTGNHFIEICLDEEQRVWAMLHSGSRGVGNLIGSYFIALARKDMERYFINLPDKDLAYLPEGSEHFNDYMKAVSWAQNYAMTNRVLMMAAVVRALGEVVSRDFTTDVEAVNSHHNYVAIERHFGEEVMVTRKGAVRAFEGDLGIIRDRWA